MHSNYIAFAALAAAGIANGAVTVTTMPRIVTQIGDGQVQGPLTNEVVTYTIPETSAAASSTGAIASASPSSMCGNTVTVTQTSVVTMTVHSTAACHVNPSATGSAGHSGVPAYTMPSPVSPGAGSGSMTATKQGPSTAVTAPATTVQTSPAGTSAVGTSAVVTSATGITPANGAGGAGMATELFSLVAAVCAVFMF